MGWSVGADGEMNMRLFIGGVRGSRPCTGGSFEEFGGDTTSLLLVGSHNERIVLDAGTGMRAVAEQLAAMKPGEVTVLFSHYHLDHLAGLMMNPLFHNSNWSFTMTGPTLGKWNVHDAVNHLLAPPYWPISYEKMKAKFDFVNYTGDDIQTGKLHVRGCSIPHPGGCVAYRIDDVNCDASLVFATDIEWQNRTNADETAFITMCSEPKPADMLIMDAHFSRADANAFAGWGHTCWEDVLEIASTAGIKKILLSHHNPQATDPELRSIEQKVQKITPEAILGRAGQWFIIGG
jgi:ribonuclease BN (tRNA processing enzyme)